MLNCQGTVYQEGTYLLTTPPLRWVSFPRKSRVNFNYKSIILFRLLPGGLLCSELDHNRMNHTVVSHGEKGLSLTDGACAHNKERFHTGASRCDIMITLNSLAKEVRYERKLYS